MVGQPLSVHAAGMSAGMPDLHILTIACLWALLASLAVAIAAWPVSVAKHNVSIVDILWGPLIVLSGAGGALALPETGPRVAVVFASAALWSLRLAAHVGRRNWSAPEDHRYQAIRRRNEPHFWLKSLYLIFVLQAVLACLVATPLIAAAASLREWGWLDTLGLIVVCGGIAFESLADWQLTRFKSDPQHQHAVMDRGLWRYSRHPNYFGEFCIWWGFYLIALAAGAWWTIVSPLLMSVLLLRVSGVTLLEKDIGERRPAYRDYIARTSSFVPLPPHAADKSS